MGKYCSQCGTRIKDGGKFCTNCGADLECNVLTNNTKNAISTEMQANLQNNNVQPNNNVEVKNSTNGFAIASFVCSLCGIFLARIVFGIIAICFSIAAKKQLKVDGQKGKGLSTAGLIIGIIDISIAVIYFFIMFIVFLTAFLSEYPAL